MLHALGLVTLFLTNIVQIVCREDLFAAQLARIIYKIFHICIMYKYIVLALTHYVCIKIFK
jgi:hypothetical protein